jgi:hypothetical protein
LELEEDRALDIWTLALIVLLALGAVAGWLSRRLPLSGWSALGLAVVPLGGMALTVLI